MKTEVAIQIVSFLILFVSLLLAFFLFSKTSKNKLGNRFLAFYLLIKALNISSYFYHDYISVPKALDLLRMDIGSFLEMPMLYLFVVSILYSDFKLEKRFLWHALPFLLITILQLPLFYLADPDTKVGFIAHYLTSPIGIFSTVLAHVQTLFYLELIFILLFRYRKVLVENYAIADDHNRKWLFQMNVFLCILFIIATLKNVQKYGATLSEILPSRFAVALGTLLFTCWLVLKALHAPEIFTGVDSKIRLNAKNDFSKEQDDSAVVEKAELLKSYMAIQKPFIESEFTIQQLSQLTAIDTREISQILNHYLKKNFYEFVNEYRIKEAKAKLIEDKSLTVLEVLYHVGYNSKSTFNTHFKASTGYTPTEFRKVHG